MVYKRKLAVRIIGIIVLVGIIFAAYSIYQSRPQHVIESKLNLKLPSSSKIINYEYDNNGGYFDAKISIEAKNVNFIKGQLNDFFGGVTVSTSKPNFKNVCSWWDMDDKNVEARYMSYIDVKKWRTIIPHQVWAFISKDKAGQYYLYISY